MLRNTKALIMWQAAVGLSAAVVAGLVNGTRIVAANQYMGLGLENAAFYSFQNAFNRNLPLVVGITVAVCLLSVLYSRVKHPARSISLSAASVVGLVLCYRLGYNLNRFQFKPFWLKSKTLLHIPLRAAMFEPHVVLANIGVLAVALCIGWLSYRVLMILIRRAGSRRVQLRQPFRPHWLILACVTGLVGINAFFIVHRARALLRGPNVIVISLDTLRADHLGCYGYQRDTSPNLDRLASSSILFENAITQSGWTLPSHKSALTSLDPPSLRRGANRKLDYRRVTLAEIMMNRGYATVGFANGLGWVTPVFGFEQGFDTYVVPGARLIPKLADAELITKLAVGWLKNHADKSFFMFLHYGDIHSDFGLRPYDAPEPYGSMYLSPGSERFERSEGDVGGSVYLQEINDGRFDPSPEEIDYIRALYDGGIRYTDVWIGTLVREMEGMGLLDNTILVIFSDHGEEFREHGKMLHGWVYCETAHVPLLIRFPEAGWGGLRVAQQVRLLDMVPTILDYLDMPVRPEMRGESLLRLVQEGGASRPAFTEGGDSYAVRADGWMFLHTLEGEHTEIYNLVDDPSERINLSEAYPEREDIMASMLVDWIRLAEANRPGRGTDQPVRLDRQTTELLKSLGYLHSGE